MNNAIDLLKISSLPEEYSQIITVFVWFWSVLRTQV